ncbi:MAG: hypothetical protein PHP45_01005, partial [Elusimicrobiales bacterium]|nr:hypothetical protein [Elusimicrobiales bacterium]
GLFARAFKDGSYRFKLLRCYVAWISHPLRIQNPDEKILERFLEACEPARIFLFGDKSNGKAAGQLLAGGFSGIYRKYCGGWI